MRLRGSGERVPCHLPAVLCLALAALFFTVPTGSPAIAGQGAWWEVVPEAEVPSPYYDSMLYSEIAPKLREIELNSNRVQVEVLGQSAGGRNLFLVTIASTDGKGRLGHYKAIRKMMLKDPEKAQQWIADTEDFKFPVLINASIHGGEYPGTDAAIRLIETLAYDDSDETRAILENMFLLINVVANPDGRVQGTRRNADGFDLSRDFVAQCQPETQAIVQVMTEWNPMVVLDLHGFVNPMLIEPCTPPHNPNYEYDLYIRWALDAAEAMEAELIAQTDETAAIIPYRDWDLGWDDWQPSYAPMYAMYHGAYGHTIETPHRDERGVDAHHAAIWGALEFAAANKQGMIHDQIEIFRRGMLDLLQQPIPPELLPSWDQYQDLMIQEFPTAYVIPAGAPMQMSAEQPADLVDFLLLNDVEVERTNAPFTLGAMTYPKGSYVVRLDQPKRGLANVILDDGLDLSDIPDIYFYSPPSVWSHPRLWGAEIAVVHGDLDVKTHRINKPTRPTGAVELGATGYYAFMPTGLAAIQATNDLLGRAVPSLRATESFEDGGRTFGPGTVVFTGDAILAEEVATTYRLDVLSLAGPPLGTVQAVAQGIAMYGDGELASCLELMGFDFDRVTSAEVNAGVLSGYDVFVNQDMRWHDLDAAGQASLTAWFGAGGDYVGLNERGRAIDFAVDAGFASVAYDDGSGNGIVKLVYDTDDPGAAGFRDEDFAFVYRPLWFTSWGGGTQVTARYDGSDFLLSGFWPDWPTSGAAGMPAILHSESGLRDVTLIGIDSTFRGHPRNTFRVLANAIYNGLD